MSLVEILVAMVILLMVGAFVSTGLVQVAMANRANRSRVVAASIAESEIDRTRATSPATLANAFGATVTTTVSGGVTYTVNRDIEPVVLGSNVGACDGGASTSASLTVYRVTVAVTWPNMGLVKPVREDTQVVPPVNDTSSGFDIAVKVTDAAGGPLANHLVTAVSGGTTRQTYTSADGCAFIAGLGAGTYDVSMHDSGYVDPQLDPAPTEQVVLPPATGTTSLTAITYDAAATLSLTLPGDAAHPVPSGVAVSIGNAGFAPVQSRSFPGDGSPRTLSGLFPFTSGYQAWLGDCADADPEGKQAAAPYDAYWPGATREAPIPVTPGGTKYAAIAGGGGVDVTVTKNGQPLAGVTVTATHAADVLCTSGESYPIGTTDASGVVRATLPYGDWTFGVQGYGNPSQSGRLAPGAGVTSVSVVAP